MGMVVGMGICMGMGMCGPVGAQDRAILFTSRPAPFFQRGLMGGILCDCCIGPLCVWVGSDSVGVGSGEG
jgi:hypothetical protein